MYTKFEIHQPNGFGIITRKPKSEGHMQAHMYACTGVRTQDNELILTEVSRSEQVVCVKLIFSL